MDLEILTLLAIKCCHFSDRFCPRFLTSLKSKVLNKVIRVKHLKFLPLTTSWLAVVGPPWLKMSPTLTEIISIPEIFRYNFKDKTFFKLNLNMLFIFRSTSIIITTIVTPPATIISNQPLSPCQSSREDWKNSNKLKGGEKLQQLMALIVEYPWSLKMLWWEKRASWLMGSIPVQLRLQTYKLIWNSKFYIMASTPPKSSEYIIREKLIC